MKELFKQSKKQLLIIGILNLIIWLLTIATTSAAVEEYGFFSWQVLVSYTPYIIFAWIWLSVFFIYAKYLLLTRNKTATWVLIFSSFSIVVFLALVDYETESIWNLFSIDFFFFNLHAMPFVFFIISPIAFLFKTEKEIHKLPINDAL